VCDGLRSHATHQRYGDNPQVGIQTGDDSLGFDISSFHSLILHSFLFNSNVTPFESEELQVIVVPDPFRHVFYDSDVTEFASMAANDSIAMEGLLTTDCGAISTLTDSLINMTDVVPKLITIQLALDGARIPFSTRAFYVKELKQDLLGDSERALIKSNYRVILDKDPDISANFLESILLRQMDQSTWETVFHLLVSTQTVTGFSSFGSQQ
jgi:hypothetical protein